MILKAQPLVNYPAKPRLNRFWTGLVVTSDKFIAFLHQSAADFSLAKLYTPLEDYHPFIPPPRGRVGKGVFYHRKTVMKTIFTRTGLALVLAGISASSAMAGMYRWTDDQGNVVYSQQPPPDNRDVRQIAPPPPPAEKTENASQSVQELQKKLDAAAQERREAMDEKKKAKAEQEQRKKRCQAARQDLKTLNERPPNTLYNMPDGQWKRLTPEERAERIKMLNKAIETNCKK